MKTLLSVFLLAMVALSACSTPQPAEPRQAAPGVATLSPSPRYPAQLAQIQPHLTPPSDEGLPDVFKGKPCLLGKSCLAMDPRPFEFCLLGTNKRCSDKAREPMQVDNPDFAPR
jgi:hypothetical protein